MTKYDRSEYAVKFAADYCDAIVIKLETDLARYKSQVEKLRLECGDQELIDSVSERVSTHEFVLAELYKAQVRKPAT